MAAVKKPTKKPTKKPIRKPVRKPTKKPTKKAVKKPTKKAARGAIKGKFYGKPGATKTASPIFKTAGKTKNYATRPSARAFFDMGLTKSRVCYGGKCHKMAFRANGSPYWKVI